MVSAPKCRDLVLESTDRPTDYDDVNYLSVCQVIFLNHACYYNKATLPGEKPDVGKNYQEALSALPNFFLDFVTGKIIVFNTASL